MEFKNIMKVIKYFNYDIMNKWTKINQKLNKLINNVTIKQSNSQSNLLIHQ